MIVGVGWARHSYGHWFPSLSGVGVYNKIVENVRYGRYVVKVECANRITRAFTSNLHELAINTIFPIAARRILKVRISRLSAAVRKAMQGFGNNSATQLCEDLKYVPQHAFGSHKSSSILDEMKEIADNVVRKASRLTQNVTTNHAERYMSFVAKFSGEKRGNYILRGASIKEEDLTNDEFARRKEEILRQLASDDCDTVVNDTVGQHDNIKWHEARRNRITASTFGRICVRRLTTSCHFLLKSMLYASQHLSTAPIIYGRLNEKKAIAKYEDKKEVKVLPCGIFI
ncbi:hypothetical protein ILUMI_15015 [Ignelater luminosus]|uniref:Uncharacterized protein n=1 Tax=Ignelater luminosus TaxID=2038154 RepID=A0A8K0CPE0_IGNLU|nr:hypothetical protein ILUMI_15015 [Ignelater luminosus]